MGKRLIIWAIVAASLLAISGCASSGKSKVTIPINDSVSFAFLTEKELIHQFGGDLSRNPFIPPNGTFFHKSWDFIIAKLTVESTSEADFEITSTSIVNQAGKTKAWLYDRATFAKYVAQISADNQSAQERVRIVDWHLVPSDRFHVKPGTHEYIMAFMGKHPVPEDLTATIRVFLGDKEYDFNDVEVPAQADQE